MKKFSKLMSLLLALALCLSLAPAAFADSGTGKITVENSTKDASYGVYKIFDATVTEKDGKVVVDEEGKPLISYKATDKQKEWFSRQDNNPFAFGETADSDGKFTVTIAESKDEGDVIEFLTSILTHTSAMDTGVTLVANERGTGNELVFDNLPYGYYFIASTTGAAVTITSNAPDVTVIDKNQKPKFDKTMGGEVGKEFNRLEDGVDANEGAFGDVINYTITLDATNYDGEEQVKSYYIFDELDAGLQFVDDPALTYTVDGKIPDPAATFKWYKHVDGVLTEATSAADADSFSIFFPWVKGDDDSAAYGANAKIEVKYSAKIDTDAVIGKDGNHNTADFWVSKDKVAPTEPKPSEDWGIEHGQEKTVTYTYALALLKVDENNKPLAGAEFELKTAEGKKIYATRHSDGTYSYAGVLEDGAEVTDGYTATFVTDAEGKIVLKGIDRGTYTATETKAPAGYNLLEDPFTVTADTVVSKTESEYHYSSSWYVQKNEKGEVIASTSETLEGYTSHSEEFDVDVAAAAFAVLNQSGSLLPSTGGIGTTIFYVVGGVLVVAALVLLVTKKRMNNRD